MKQRLLRSCSCPLPRSVLLAVLCLLMPGVLIAADPAGDGDRLRIRLQPSAYAVLAQHLVQADENRRREYADLTLITLLEAYQRELERAVHERADTRAQREKLASWRRGTADMIRRLEALRWALHDGGTVSIHVNHRHGVMIVVDGQAVVVSGPRIEIEPEIERLIVERYCAANDCSHLESEPQAAETGDQPLPRSRREGGWILDEATQPIFQSGALLRCRFASFTRKEAKEAICHQAADELAQLASALGQAKAQGYRIDWGYLGRAAPAGGPDWRLVINGKGEFVRLALPLLARFGRQDWYRTVEWLRLKGAAESRIPLIEQADRLLGAGPGR